MTTGLHHLSDIPNVSSIHHRNVNDAQAPTTDGFPKMSPAADGTDKSFRLGPFAIDECRPMRVVVIGGGVSGIIAGIRVPQRVRNVELVIYEKDAGIGGTWLVNKYPGLACDIPAHCYTLTFEPNPHWSSFYATGPEIRAYFERIVDKYKLMRYIKLNHELTKAAWDSQAGKWNLTVSTPNGEIQDVADVVINCTGALSRWKWPEIQGLFDFQGSVVHSAEWNLEKEDKNEPWEGKHVAVIGVGSSAIQIVPNVQPQAAKVANFARGKTWVTAPWASREIQVRNPGGDNHYFTEEEHRQFDDPVYYAAFRHGMDDELNSVHGGSLRDHPLQLSGMKLFREDMTKRLAKKPWIADHIIPDFPVACRRLTPGPGYLEALVQDNVEFVTDTIKCVTKTGIETVDGKHRDFDIIVCATGFETTWKPRFSVIGRDGVSLQDKWDPYPRTYLGLVTDGFPNWFQCFGPNTGVGSGSLLIFLERQIDYAVSAIVKLQREQLKSIDVKKEAVQDFDELIENYFPKTVFSEKCPSWYKQGHQEGRIVGLWPGSCLHALRSIEHPRWEDYNYEHLDKHPGSHNRLHWLGDGWTVNEKNESGDRAWYLNNIDYPPVPE